MIQACAFDLGNTLSDDTALYDRALAQIAQSLEDRHLVDSGQRFLSRFDQINRETTLPFISHTFGELQMFQTAFDELGVTGLSAEDGLKLYRETVIAQTTLEPQIEAGLRWLGELGIRRGLFSNERAARVDGWFSATGARNLFEMVFVSESAGVEKPDARFFELALKRMGLNANEVVMFGDNTIADGACRNLGMPFVHVTAFSTQRWYFEKGEPHQPDFVLAGISPSGLKRCLGELAPDQRLG
jgi:HAD superfamily hydrolase (TIGR01509 family)